jgi:BirA family biotin operon repressor/biotin-[acetyl-CoA-carboxylase] ligase
VSLSESIESLCRDASIGLEWPNDLRLGRGKVGGVLCQARSAEDVAWVAVGFGVNVEVAPELGADGAVTAVSLREVGFTGSAGEFSRRLAVAFAIRFRALLGHAEETRTRWMSRSVHGMGDPIRVSSGGKTVEGRFAGLARDGRLRVETGGSEISIASGEVLSAL